MGVDSGFSGAVAFYSPDHESRIVLDDMPRFESEIDIDSLTSMIKKMAPKIAVIERGGAPGGKAFTTGVGYGMILAVIRLLPIDTYVVAPNTWKYYFELSAAKDESRFLAMDFWPSAGCFSRGKDHHRAEAALIALYGAEVCISEPPKPPAKHVLRRSTRSTRSILR
jgi:crossover junction endodeoxyribonuclease RuvC